ncbi:hypothetical protein BMS3Abin16_01230 [archaeon BMS3Abin16]|nr:hypothetical protein BMS3Abin16_01230 [archaeon BMS3Abin16]
MVDNKILVALVVLTVLSTAFSAQLVWRQRSEISIPIPADVALDTVKSEQSAKAFIEENFGAPEDRIERVSLAWDPAGDSYLWEIEIQENSCGCKFNETEGVTILKASVDPYNGAIYNLTSRVGVPEDTIKREACEKGCHIE